MSESLHHLIGQIISPAPRAQAPAPLRASAVFPAPLEVLIGRICSAPGAQLRLEAVVPAPAAREEPMPVIVAPPAM